MRHGKKFNHLGRKTAHRDAMLSNMAISLIRHKRINTTVAKAKALRKYIEPILTKSKKDDMHSRRVVFSYLQDKASVTELFNNVAEKIAARPGGYTRIIKTDARPGDNAEMCMMELVDFNELLIGEETSKTKSTRRSRRGKGKAKAETSVVAEAATETEEAQADVAEEPAVDTESEATDTAADVDAVAGEADAVDEIPTEEANTQENSDEEDSEQKKD